jgi:hypothetical protein
MVVHASRELVGLEQVGGQAWSLRVRHAYALCESGGVRVRVLAPRMTLLLLLLRALTPSTWSWVSSIRVAQV